MAVNDKARNDTTAQSLAQIGNQSFDQELQLSVVETMGFDGQSVQRPVADSMAQKVTISGSVTYMGIAAPGSAQTSAVWQCKKVDTSTGIVTTWADGNANFDNLAVDLASLSYS